MPVPPSTNPPTASDKDCAICHEPLLVPSSNDDKLSFIIDDVEFRCKHHFHWACILEYATSSNDARNRCALCRQSVLDSRGKFIVYVRNEGGVTGGINFGEEIDRHLYYKMDFSDAELLLKGEDSDANGKIDPDVCYDSDRMTTMHMVALNDDVEGIQLLLKYGANKDFKSEDGQTALDMAKEVNATNVIALLTAEGEEWKEVAGLTCGGQDDVPLLTYEVLTADSVDLDEPNRVGRHIIAWLLDEDEDTLEITVENAIIQ
ncbi:hypothetical protein N0V83_004480 [Neocucurbitaria cava]|uniref:RING-type domain-containing protein n=1 Tax=Neocucurbitaria cava TaxID=798079 RepID=A0A9W9CMI6_9PLEO|nr:hypothetical protein N0V83_004480 [Neocucurbitaria cava]